VGTGNRGTGSAGTGNRGTESAGTGSRGTGSVGTGSRGTESAGTGSRGIMRTINIRSKKGIPTFSAISGSKLVGKQLAAPPAVPSISLTPELSTEMPEESLVKEEEEPPKSPEEICHINTRHIHIKHPNDASFNMFIIFISRMSSLMELNRSLSLAGYNPGSFEDITQLLYNEKIRIEESFEYLKTLLDLANKVPVTGTKIRNYENVFKLLKSFEFAKNKNQSDRVYALDELGFNLVLLAAASTIYSPAKETYESIHGTLSDILYSYKSSSVDIRSYYLRSFSRYFEKFRISETLIPMVNDFEFIEGLQYFLAENEIKFKDKHGNVGSLEKVIDASLSKTPEYIIATFYPDPEYSEGARGIDSFETHRYKIVSVIFKLKDDNALLSVIGSKALYLITGKDIISSSRLELLCYERQGTLLEALEKIDQERIRNGIPSLNLSSSSIIAILYELNPTFAKFYKEVRFVCHIDFGNVGPMMRRQKGKFKDSIIKKFLDKYNSFKPRDANTTIFRVLEFIKLSTGSIESYNSVITDYLFGKGNAGNARISVAPFVEKVMEDFSKIKFRLTFSDEEDSEKIWKSIMQEIESYKEEGTTTKALLEDAIENAMTLFSFTLNNISPFAALKERAHCDYILATIYLIKRLWKVYDRCIDVMRLLPEKSGHDDQEKLLRYLLLKFNKLIYVKCYFASFSNNLVSNQELEEKRLELRKHL
jgi:hypothetical protein